MRLLFGAALLPIALFALVAEERLIAHAQLLLELGDPHLKGRRVPALQRVDARLKLEILLDEPFVFRFEQCGRLMQALRVAFEVIERRHARGLTQRRDD